MDKVIDVCYRRGFVIPTAEIYGGAGGFYDYGPIGTLMKQKIIDYWRQTFVLDEDHVYEVSGNLILPEDVFRASGHLDAFNDPLVQCKKCKAMYRADQLIRQQLNINAEGLELEELDKIIKENNLVCPSCSGELGQTRQFNLMFKTIIGPTGGYAGYLRPETAQNIFISFKRLASIMRNKLPFGIAQVGHSFRNEISPRNFLLRVREFEQMEIELFYDPEEANNFPNFEEVEDLKIRLVTREMQEKGWNKPLEITAKEAIEKNYVPNQVICYYMVLESEMLKNFGIPEDSFWFRHMREHETPHYSGGNFDLEVQLEQGPIEIIGNAIRRDYDLLKHSKASKTSYEIVVNNKKVLPHVVEPSMGVDRIFYTILEKCYREGDRDWTWFQFPAVIAPIEVAVLPLMKKDGLAEFAYDIHTDLKEAGYISMYDDSGKIGKRYARADEIGIPYCITVDYQTLENNSVTIRDRDTMKQIRVELEDLEVILGELMDGETEFREFLDENSN